VKRGAAADSIVVDGDGETTVGREVGTVGVGDMTELVDTSDESANKAEVDERDEDCRLPSGLATDHRYEGPGCAKHRNYKEGADSVVSTRSTAEKQMMHSQY
ncbi:MAG: hypothetical protein Q9190_004117, partial [Brigantiaea leucoxantha]